MSNQPTSKVEHDAIRVDRFRIIYDANYSGVLGYALRRSARAEDAADIVAETFLTAWRRLDDLPADDQLRPWLYGVARRMLANQRRGEARQLSLAARLRDELRSADVSPGPSSQESDALSMAFGSLRPNDREVLALVAWEDLGTAELATVLRCSQNAAKIRLHRARRRLHRALASLDVGADISAQSANPDRPLGQPVAGVREAR